MGQKTPSLRDKLAGDGRAEARGFVTNHRVRSDFFDEGADFIKISA